MLVRRYGIKPSQWRSSALTPLPDTESEESVVIRRALLRLRFRRGLSVSGSGCFGDCARQDGVFVCFDHHRCCHAWMSS